MMILYGADDDVYDADGLVAVTDHHTLPYIIPICTSPPKKKTNPCSFSFVVGERTTTTKQTPSRAESVCVVHIMLLSWYIMWGMQ